MIGLLFARQKLKTVLCCAQQNCRSAIGPNGGGCMNSVQAFFDYFRPDVVQYCALYQ